jgi:hypothetical protein
MLVVDNDCRQEFALVCDSKEQLRERRGLRHVVLVVNVQ